MIARLALIAAVLFVPAASAAELRIGAVVLKTARLSVQSPSRIALETNSPDAVQVTVQTAGDGHQRVVFTP